MSSRLTIMPPQLADALWQEEDLPVLLDALAKAAELETQHAELPTPGGAIDAWMETACAHIGLEAEPLTLRVTELLERLRSAAPAVIRTGDGYLGLLGIHRRRAHLIVRDGSTLRVKLCDIEAHLLQPLEEPIRDEVQSMLRECGLDAHENGPALEALLRARLGDTIAATCWQLRTPPGAGLWRQLRETGLSWRLHVLLAAHALEYILWLASWRLIGAGALNGRVDSAWMIAWLMLLMTMLPFRLLTTWTQGFLSIGFGGLLRQRILAGALNMDPGQIRREGAGQLLGRALEAETLESLALAGGFNTALAFIEAIFALTIMASGVGGSLQALAFGLCIALATLLGWDACRRRSIWTQERLALTHDLVERMTGHRTRLAQQSPREWHLGEDGAMDTYLNSARGMDRYAGFVTGLVPRAWLFLGLLSLAPAFLAPHPSPAAMAIGIAGSLLGYRALNKMVAGALQVAGAWIAWRQVGPLYRAASQGASPGRFVEPSNGVVIDARELSFQYPGREKAVVSGANLTIHPGDRILLEGESGGGKSTFSSLLAGMHDPASGLLLAGGLDRATLGSRAWRRVVTAAPQYHENHVLSGSLAFNLLMGRQWPPSLQDLKEAREVCQELGLGPLLDRMPGGLDQMVGETGWQLSQGERSRLFMARALLQKPSLVVLDETFAALDPENLRQALTCTLRRAKTLLVVAHPSS
jgi:ATP-binding cassette subfamily B protein